MNTPKGGTLATLTLHDLGHDGRGVGRHDGKTVFVAGALPGEHVTARILARHSRFDEAQLVEVLEPAADRVVPPCPHAGRCGGCTLQHLAPAAQLAARQRRLEQALARIARIEPRRWLEPITSAPWGYRARARLAVSRAGHGGRLHLGYRSEESRAIEPILQCAVLEPALAALLEPLAALLESLQGSDNVQEILLASGDTGIAMAFDCRAEPTAADRALLEAFCAGRALTIALRSAGGPWQGDEAALGYAPEPGTMLRFAPWHFTQSNRAVNRALVARVLDLLDPAANDRVLDLFCGIGNFTLPLARRAGSVLGVEGGAAELARARANAEDNDLRNVEFSQADLARDPGTAGWARTRFDRVLLDPPRAGAAALVPVLRRLASRRLCYVSCDAATLARDSALLIKAGFQLTAAGVLDMFPHTAHAEAVALFER